VARLDTASLGAEDSAFDPIESRVGSAIRGVALGPNCAESAPCFLRAHAHVDLVAIACGEPCGDAHGPLEPIAAGPSGAHHGALLRSLHLRWGHRASPDADRTVVDLDDRRAVGARKLPNGAEPD